MRKVKLSIILILIVCSMASLVMAADIAKVDITAPNEVAVGKTISVSIPVTGIDEGVNGLQGTLKYDSNVLELIDGKPNTTANGWMISGYNEETGIFLVEPQDVSDKSIYITDTTDLVTFEFKVKDDAELGETEVNIKNLVASGVPSLESTEISKKLNVVGASVNNTVANVTVTNNTVNNTTNTANNTNNNKTSGGSTSNTSKNNTAAATTQNTADNTANKKIPYAGEESIIFKASIGFIVIAVIFYLKYKKYEDIV